MRTTIKYRELIEDANAFLRNSGPSQTAERQGVHDFVQRLLLNADVYGGFNYVDGYDKGDNTRTFFLASRKLDKRDNRTI